MLSAERFIVSYIEQNQDFYHMFSYENAKLAVMDHIFNVIGNGIHNTRQFIQYISIKDSGKPEEEVAELFSGFQKIPDNILKGFEEILETINDSTEKAESFKRELMQKERIDFNPYPNFNKDYSTIYFLDFNRLGKHKQSWVKAIQDFYQYCIEYLNSDKSLNNFYAYPSNSEDKNKRKIDEMKDYLSRKYNGFDEGNEDVYNQIVKDYGISSFNGDINQMLCDMWTKNKKNWIQFSKEAIEYLETV